ncbi:ATPase, T2SS/T4P/T4SS family [Bacillus subtilis]|uniref:ATPase, T2SS/T4P/T4SS family n=1 Tax=Bacillus subtilis TaxID=1423 RepID=UPI003F840B96
MGLGTKTVSSLEEVLGLGDPFSSKSFIDEVNESKKLQDDGVGGDVFESHPEFKRICAIVEEKMREKAGESVDDGGSKEFLERQHKAVIGDPKAIDSFMQEIQKILGDNNLSTKSFPDIFEDLPTAVFHMIWGVGILHKWDKMPNSEAAVIRGTQLWIDVNGRMELQEESFETLEEVERVRKVFLLKKADSVINSQNPELEVEREDGTRITMTQSPRSLEHYIVFRRFVVKETSLKKQAELGTIPMRDVPLYEAFSRVMANIIFAGRVRSAKSTFLKAMIGARPDDHIIAVLEKHHELALSKAFPSRLIYEVQAKEGDLHKAVPTLLRMEHDSLVVGEIRSLETEAYLEATERGERGAFSTYHLTDVENVTQQITRHLLDEFPNRDFDNEHARVAQNIDLIFIHTSERDRRSKRLVRVTEIVWDEGNKRVITQDLIRWSPIKKKYYYSSSISKRLLLLMLEQNEEETRKLVRILSERERESPLSEYKDEEYKIVEDLLGEVRDAEFIES